ncbi:MAG: ATP-binding cassette domain-containing protein [Bacteroidetes bacterium]|nr:ATP-binding cassette domain-containing protein [Bacteroidota bacterium]MCB0845580.1 ATP-binding cassette domain-containing protein [Bacteroidota bacterium]
METNIPNLHIRLENIGKKFYHRWIFKDINHDFQSSPRLALVGKNGSGKSTLLRIIAGQLSPSSGKISGLRGKQKVSVDHFYRYISWAGPFTTLYPDLTISEQVNLHFQFKSCLIDKPAQLIDILDLTSHQDKKLRFYSSGMLQRAKVGLALFTQSDVLLLDEPTSNMDPENAEKILGLIENHLGDRTYVLASNMEREFQSFDHILRL